MAITTNNSNIENSLLIMNGDERKISAKVQVNLQSYLHIFNEEGAEGENFKSCRTELMDKVSGLSGHLFWERILSCALENAKLNLQNQDEIKNSPACHYMYDGFIEILKNAMDEAILAHYDTGVAPQLELVLDIDLSIPEQITMTLADNGRGFSISFLENNASLQDKEKYIRENKGSSKVDTGNLPPLFGGAGLGLRTLMAKTLFGAVLAGPGFLIPKYEKPSLSCIHFENKAGGFLGEQGAVIRIATSLAPLVEINVQHIKNDTPIIRLPPRKKPKMLPDVPGSYQKTMVFLNNEDAVFQQSETKKLNDENQDCLLHANLVLEKKLVQVPFLLSENLHGHFSRQDVVRFESSEEPLKTISTLSN